MNWIKVMLQCRSITMFRSKKIAKYIAPGRRVHLVGIGGVSMRPLGLVL